MEENGIRLLRQERPRPLRGFGLQAVRASRASVLSAGHPRPARAAAPFALALSLALALGLLGCTQDGGEEPLVDEGSVVDVPAYSAFAGVATTSDDVKVNKKDSVAVGEVLVKVGDLVSKGDVLFTYDVEKATLDLEKAQLELAQMESSLAMLEANKASLEKEKEKADENQKLSYSLEIQEKENSILEEEYRIQGKKREIDSLTALVEDASVVAPVDGTIRSIADGSDTSSDPYGMGGGADTGGAFIVISKTDDILVMGSVNEANLAEVYEGMAVTVRSRTTDASWTGTVTSVDREKPLQSGNSYYYDPSQSSKYPFYVALDSADGLIVGQHVYIVAEFAPAMGLVEDGALAEGVEAIDEALMGEGAEGALIDGAPGDGMASGEGLDADGAPGGEDVLDDDVRSALSSTGEASPAPSGAVALDAPAGR